MPANQGRLNGVFGAASVNFSVTQFAILFARRSTKQRVKFLLPRFIQILSQPAVAGLIADGENNFPDPNGV